MSALCHAHDKFNPLALINSSARDPEKEIEIQSGWLLSRTCETLAYIVITILVERLKLVHLAVFTRDWEGHGLSCFIPSARGWPSMVGQMRYSCWPRHFYFNANYNPSFPQHSVLTLCGNRISITIRLRLWIHSKATAGENVPQEAFVGTPIP